MNAPIRDYAAADAETVVALSPRAWAPVVASMELIAGNELVVRPPGQDGREYRARPVREVTGSGLARSAWFVSAGA